MRKKIAKILVWCASKLCPNVYRVVEEVNGYEAMKLGQTLCISSEEISHYRLPNSLSYREAQAKAIDEMKRRIRQNIYATIIDGKHVEYEVRKEGSDLIVAGYIRIYRRKGDGK